MDPIEATTAATKLRELGDNFISTQVAKNLGVVRSILTHRIDRI